MSVIKDGVISGRLPSAEAFAVHYPGYPTSISRAIETLGGIDAITKARNSNSDKLELRFRPEDPCSHPIYGQLHPGNNFLLKISKKICSEDQIADLPGPHNKDSEQISDCKDGHISADIVARIEEQYRFNGMADYQHVIPVHADVARKRKRSLTELDSSDEFGAPADADENLMILLPPLFSLKDTPENLVLRPSAMISSKKKLEGVVQHRWEMSIEPCLAIDYNIKEIPKRVNWEEHIPQHSEQWKPQMAVSKLFDERPIWHKTSICERLATLGYKFGETALKRLLFRVAYYFRSGPFHRLWIRKGYDPRQDPESRIFQVIDFRLPPHLKVNSDLPDGSKPKWEDICSFRIFPSKYTTYLQLCELSDDYIQQEIQKAPKQTICTSTAGWFSPYTLYRFRLRIAMRFISVYPQAGAERMLKSLSEKFEKSKRVRDVAAANIKSNIEGDSQVSEEPTLDKDHEVEKEMEYGDNEDEDEDVEVEDDYIYEDPYAFDMTELGGDFCLQADSYQGGENASKDFLQGLIGGFSSSLGDNALPNSESDEEYQIYEQHDGSDSNDDYL